MTFTFLILCFPASSSRVQLSIVTNSLENDVVKNSADISCRCWFWLSSKG